MHSQKTVAVMALAGLAAAQRPESTPICDYYTQGVFGANTAENQLKLVTAVVMRAGVGNMTVTPAVNGIVVPGKYNGVDVDLSPYFNGMLNSTNRGGSSGVSVNFLDGGSNQNTLFTHLNEYFGALLGCTQYGMTGYPGYEGKGSQYEVHKFMDLDENEVGYFNTQVALSATSFGVSDSDVKAIGMSLNSVFNVKCAPATVVVPAQGAQLQSICIADSCPLAVNSSCTGYATPLMPVNITMTNGTSSSGSSNSSSMGGSGSSSGSGSSTGTSSSSPAQQTTNAGASVAISAVLGMAALALAL